MRMRGGRVRRGRVVIRLGRLSSTRTLRYPGARSRLHLGRHGTGRAQELRCAVGGRTRFNRRCLMEARITAQSQSFRLRERLEEAKVAHGEEARVDLPGVRVAVLDATGEAQLMFCNMGSIRVRQLMQRGDERPLATDVTLEGLQVPAVGIYDLVNAYLSVNGSIHVRVDAESEVVPARDLVQKG